MRVRHVAALSTPPLRVSLSCFHSLCPLPHPFLLLLVLLGQEQPLPLFLISTYAYFVSFTCFSGLGVCFQRYRLDLHILVSFYKKKGVMMDAYVPYDVLLRTLPLPRRCLFLLSLLGVLF